MNNPVLPLDIRSLWNCSDERTWKIALEHYWTLLSDKQLRLEQNILSITYRDLQRLSSSDFYNFLYQHYFVWKYTQPNRLATTRRNLQKYISEGCINDLEQIKHDLFHADRSNIKACISIVTQIRGLGVAGASGLLALLFPEDFGTVDQFVVKALLQIHDLPEKGLLENMNPDTLKPGDAEILIRIMQKKSEDLNTLFHTRYWTPRKIDMILWAIGR